MAFSTLEVIVVDVMLTGHAPIVVTKSLDIQCWTSINTRNVFILSAIFSRELIDLNKQPSQWWICLVYRIVSDAQQLYWMYQQLNRMFKQLATLMNS